MIKVIGLVSSWFWRKYYLRPYLDILVGGKVAK